MKLFCFILIATATIVAVRSQAVNLTAFRRCGMIHQSRVCQQADERTIRVNLAIEALRCNRTDFAVDTAYECARPPASSNTVVPYCALTPYYGAEVRNLLLSVCTPIVYRYGTCSLQCTAGLQSLRRELGCCINAVYNNTESVLGNSGIAPLFSDRVWSACGVPPITETCTPEFDIEDLNVPEPSRTCNYTEISTRILNRACNAPVYEEIRREIENIDECGETYLQFFRQLCGTDSDGVYCTAIENDFNNYITPLLASCMVNQITCSPGCQTTLRNFVSNRGCCVNNYYNSTLAQVFGLDLPLLANRAVFEQCRLTPPPLECSLPFTITSGSLSSLKAGFTIFLLIPLVVYIMSLLGN